MFCPNCGTQLPDGSTSCPSCGATIGVPAQEAPVTPEPEPTTPPIPGAPPVPGATQYESSASYPVPADAVDASAAPPLKGSKFVSGVQLFLSALSLAGTGVMLLTGAQYMTEYGNAKDLVYTFYAGLQVVDIVFAVVFIALAVFAIVVRMNLAKFKRGATNQYLAFLGGNIVAQILYLVALAIVTQVGPLETLDSSTVIQLVSSVVMIVLSKIYFDKRAYLFTN